MTVLPVLVVSFMDWCSWTLGSTEKMDDEEALRLAVNSDYYTGNCSICGIGVNPRVCMLVEHIYICDAAFRRNRADSR